jgi:hypothetical protein
MTRALYFYYTYSIGTQEEEFYIPMVYYFYKFYTLYTYMYQVPTLKIEKGLPGIMYL